MITIRPYKNADSFVLTPLFNDLNPAESVTTSQLDSRLSAWSMTWVVCMNSQPVGYARAAPLPGLPGQYDLDVTVGRNWQRRRLGSKLVDFLKAELADSEVSHLSWGVTDSQKSLAEFLLHNGFDIDHEEQILARPHLDDLPIAPIQSNLHIKIFARRKAIQLFCHLYKASFVGHPWYQPYTSDEVAADLISARDILFLMDSQRPLGTAWLHIDENREGKVEPIGIIPEGQGCGNGRFLFLSALHELKQRGAQRAIIGAWTTNIPAITLYQSLGFQKSQTITYYAYAF